MNRTLVIAIVSAAVAGCAPRYVYAPTENGIASMQGRPAADYQVPPATPQGDVRIASYGFTEVTPKSGGGNVFRALHLRLVLADNAATPWTFDTREQRLDLRTRGPIAPAFASADPGPPPPLVTIPPGGRRVFDLFFLLPPDLQHADEIPEFDALWRVGTSAGDVAERTPFERLIVEPAYAAWNGDYGPDYYWGDPYWINPSFPYGDVAPGYFVGGVEIRRAPHFGHSGAYRGGGGFHSDGHR